MLILTDIEGTTSSISFVKDVLFPYARRALPALVRARGQEPEVRRWLDAVATEHGAVCSDEVIVEIPRGSRNKYEIDHHTHEVWLDRHLFQATVYPAEYGFFPDTLAEDGDPLDALVLLGEPTFPGCHIRTRPVASDP